MPLVSFFRFPRPPVHARRAVVRSSALGLVAATACALGPKIQLFPISTSAKPTVLKNYEMGVVRTAMVGDPIFRVQQALETHAYIAQRGFHHRDFGAISMGARYAATDSTAHGTLRLMNCGGYGGPEYLLVDPDFKSLWVTDGSGKLYPLKTGDQPLFEPSNRIQNKPGAFTAELIYSGLAGKVMRAVYREYVGDMARPAFSQELQYDVGTDRTIAYKSLRMRVDSASNSAIRYEVTSDEGLPWLPESNAISRCD